MPANIDIKKRRKRFKRQAVLGVCLFSALLLPVAGVFAGLCWIPELPLLLKVLFAALAVITLIPMGLALVVLKQRFKEIEGGELDAAAEY